MPQWRIALAPLAIAAGYATAIFLLGGATPDHRKMVVEAMNQQLVSIATQILRG